MKTRFEYTVGGEKRSEIAFTPSVFAYNRVAQRLMSIADVGSVHATTI